MKNGKRKNERAEAAAILERCNAPEWVKQTCATVEDALRWERENAPTPAPAPDFVFDDSPPFDDAPHASVASSSATDSPWQRELDVALVDVRDALGAERSTKTKQPMFTDGRKLLDVKFDDETWLVDGLVTRGGTMLIVAEPKVGKTWVATELSIAVATGTRAFDRFHVKHGRVAYFYAEDRDRQIRNRLRALLAGRGEHLSPGRWFACPRGKHIDITRDEDLAWIVASVRALGVPIDLLLLDPLRNVHSADEDKSGPMGDVMARLRVLEKLLGCTVGGVHHKGKSSGDTARRRQGQQARGSSAIHGSVDSGIYLDPLDEELADADEVRVFRVLGTPEVKGARSAPRFASELVIDDDENGEATRATWREAELPVPKPLVERATTRMLTVARAHPEGFANKTELVKAVGGNTTATCNAIKNELKIGGALERRGDGRIYARPEALPS